MENMTKRVLSVVVAFALLLSVVTVSMVKEKTIVNAASKTVKVTYNANGGKFTAKKYSKKKSVVKKIKSGKKLGTTPKISRVGYKFDGWYTSKYGGKKVTAKTKIKKNQKLYASWIPKKYTVKFVMNGGVSHKSIKVYYNEYYMDAFYFEGVRPVRSGYYLEGWYTSNTGGKKITWNTKHKVTKNVTLYARWKVRNLDLKPGLAGRLGKKISEVKAEVPEIKEEVMKESKGSVYKYFDATNEG